MASSMLSSRLIKPLRPIQVQASRIRAFATISELKEPGSHQRQKLGNKVKIVEVGPRDGLQNEKTTISADVKLEMIERLAQSGLTAIEAGSFVAPRWVPQMAASDRILEHILSRTPASAGSIAYSFLAPNSKGLDNALAILAKYSHAKTTEISMTSPPSPENGNPPPLNTSLNNSNGMPSRVQEHARTTTLEDEKGPSLNTSSIDPNTVSGSEQSRASVMLPEGTSPSLNTSTNDPNAMPGGMQHKGSKLAHNKTSPSLRASSDGPNAKHGRSQVSRTSANRPSIEFSVFPAATESFTRKNLNCDIATSMERFKLVIQGAKAAGYRVRAYISVVLGCPFEGYNVDPHKVAEMATELLEMGADEIDLGDTTGMGTAPRTAELLRVMSSAGVRNEDIAMHFHDTYGQALVNTAVALEHGIRTFDSSVGGLGGCPYSPGATGNVATEDMIYFLESLGMDTGINLDAVADIGSWITNKIGKPNSSSVGKAILGKRNG